MACVEILEKTLYLKKPASKRITFLAFVTGLTILFFCLTFHKEFKNHGPRYLKIQNTWNRIQLIHAESNKVSDNHILTKKSIDNTRLSQVKVTCDDCQANSDVPPLSQPFPYGKKKIKGVNIGGWLVLEPFITPSKFEEHTGFEAVDETVVCEHLGQDDCINWAKDHYKTFITESTMREIRDAGFDHVRIPYPFWAVKESDDPNHPYFVAWNYLVNAVEWARNNGLRVFIELHSLPGNQNGWNHGGREGQQEFLAGPNGVSNGELGIEIHKIVAKYFAQEKYRNVVTMYGLANEAVSFYCGFDQWLNWHQRAYKAVEEAGFKNYIVICDTYQPPIAFVGKFPRSEYPKIMVDVHAYTIFDSYLLLLQPQERYNFVRDVYSTNIRQFEEIVGPTVVGEWSVADTDCAAHLNSFRAGSRWEGQLLADDDPFRRARSCEPYRKQWNELSDEYKMFLQDYLHVQQDAYNEGFGSFYWTWRMENSSVHWSYEQLKKAGIQLK